MDRNRDAVARNVASDAVKAVLEGNRQHDGIKRDLLDEFMFSGIPASEWYSVIVDAASRVVDQEPPDVPVHVADRMRQLREHRGHPEPEDVLEAQLVARELLRELAQQLHAQRHGPGGFEV